MSDNMEQKQIDTVSFEIISSQKLKDLVLSKKQIIHILDAINYFTDYLNESNPIGTEAACLLKIKVKELNELNEYIQAIAKYDYEKMKNKAINKHLNSKGDDPGMETMEWLAK